MTPPARLDVVVVNWNTGRYLATCLESVHRSAASVDLGRVIVVDNGSTDDSLARAAPWLDLPQSLVVRNPTNAGFAAACNAGARLGDAPLVLFLNPDARVLGCTLSRVVAFFGTPAARTVGICGARMLDEAGRPDIAGGPFPTPRVLLGHVTRLSRLLPSLFPAKRTASVARSGPIGHVIGAFLVVRRNLFEQLGGFDERYFVYYEEVDLCWRARQLGWASYHLADAEVVHTGQVSSSQIGGRRLAYSLSSRRLYARAHWNLRQRLLLALLTVAVELPARLVAESFRTGRLPIETVRGYAGHLRAMTRPRDRVRRQPEEASCGVW